MFENRKIIDIKSITLEECFYYANMGMYVIVRDGKIKGFTRYNN